MAADPRTSVVGLMDDLNKSMTDFRTHESKVKGLKAGIASTNVRIGMADSKLSSAELSRLVERYLDAW